MGDVAAEMAAREPETGAANARRRRARSVREMRARLTSETGDHPFEGDLLRIYAVSRTSSESIAISLAVTIAAMSVFWIDWQSAALWGVLVVASLIVASVLARTFLARQADEGSVARWRRRFVLSEAAAGAAWAGLVIPFLFTQSGNSDTFLFVILMLVGAMNAVTVATVPRAVFAAIMPTTIATLATALQGADNGTKLPLTLFACGTQLFFIALASRLHDTSLGQITFRAQKDELIAELEQAKAVSDEARFRAEEANLAKSRFLATMSHELRTPLNAILGFSEVMKGELFGAHTVPSYKEYAVDIHASGQHLLTLINEILDLSRIEAGRFELREDAVSLPGIISDCRHLLTMRARKRDIAIAEAIETNLPRIWADERAIRQVVLNLLTNAIKFTPTGGHVTIKVGWTGAGGQYVSVRDTGPGIPENEMSLVLSSFGRGSLAQKNAEEGSGLGLPIVQGLVELHGGHFLLRSKVREGTEAIVILPPSRVMDALPKLEGGEQKAA